MDNSSYLEIRTLFNKFLKKDYWQRYTAADIFFIHNIIKNKESFLTFIDSFYGDGFGIQLFNNKDGFNYVHDIFTAAAPEYLTVSECDSVCAVYIARDELKEDEIAYLRKRNIRIKAENNLIIYRFKKGYQMGFASSSDEKLIFKAIELLDSVLRNDREIVEASFQGDLCAYVDVNTEKLEYTLIPRPLPYLEIVPRRKKANLALVEELRDTNFISDEAYLFSSYLPLTIKETMERPLAVYLIYPNNSLHYLGYVIDKPGNYDDKLFTIIYDAFTSIGKPLSVTFSSRDLFASLSKTLQELSIEVKVDKNKCTEYVGIHNMLARFYTEDICEAELSEAEALAILEATAASINQSEYNLEPDEEYDSVDSANVSDLMVS